MGIKKAVTFMTAAALMIGMTMSSFAQSAEEWTKSQLSKQAQPYYVESLDQIHKYNTTIKLKYEGDIQVAVDAAASTVDMLKKQNPDLFWVSYEKQNFNATKGVITTTLPVYGKYLTDGGKLNTALVQETQAKIDAVVKQIGKGKTTFESVQIFNDYLANQTKYNSQFNNNDSYELTGSLLNGGSVCEGFAKGFKFLCDQAGIDCVQVSGSGILSGTKYPYHEWCYVKMDDGKWYLVDPTWNSLAANKEKWFLAGANANIDNMALLQSHTPDGVKYPTLSENSYGE